MPPRHPPVTVERLLRWTAANEVPDESLVYDDNGRMVTTVRYDKPTRRLYLETADPDRTDRKPFTLRLFLQTTESLGAADDVQLWYDGGRLFDNQPVIDLGDGDSEGFDVSGTFPAGHYLFLQRRWG